MKGRALVQRPVQLQRLPSFHCAILPFCRKLNLWFHLEYEETSGIFVFNHISDTGSGAQGIAPMAPHWEWVRGEKKCWSQVFCYQNNPHRRGPAELGSVWARRCRGFISKVRGQNLNSSPAPHPPSSPAHWGGAASGCRLSGRGRAPRCWGS